MYINTTGLVLRQAEYKDSGKILTVLTAGEGKLTVSARGAKRKNSALMASSQPLAYSEMTLYGSKDRWTLTEARSIELFSGLAEDVARLALGSYFAELAESVSDEDCPGPELLSLILNALYALSEGLREESVVKAATEMRLMCLSGFAPRLDACAACGDTAPREPRLDLPGGAVYCKKCAPSGAAALCSGSLEALRHIAGSQPKRVYSFHISQQAGKRLGQASEEYVRKHLDRRFKTLEFYHSLAMQY